MSVRRVYVEKKPDYAVKAKELREEIESYLGIETVTGVRVLIRYDIENLSEETYRAALGTIFSEPPVDDLYEEEFGRGEADTVFSVEYLPGQFDQRADSAEQCVKLLNENEEPVIRTATTYVISGALSKEQEEAVIATAPENLVEYFISVRELASDQAQLLLVEKYYRLSQHYQQLYNGLRSQAQQLYHQMRRQSLEKVQEAV